MTTGDASQGREEKKVVYCIVGGWNVLLAVTWNVEIWTDMFSLKTSFKLSFTKTFKIKALQTES